VAAYAGIEVTVRGGVSHGRTIQFNFSCQTVSEKYGLASPLPSVLDCGGPYCFTPEAYVAQHTYRRLSGEEDDHQQNSEKGGN